MRVEVQNREQVEEGENVEARETEEEDKTRKQQTLRHVDENVLCRHVVRHLEPQCDVCTRMKVRICARKTRCEGVLSTHPVGYSGSLSTVNETNCNKKEI